MARVDFNLKTFGLDPTRPKFARMVFSPVPRAAIGRDGVRIGQVIVPYEAINELTGDGFAELQPTIGLSPDTFYRLSIEWSEDSPEGWVELNAEIRVPAVGGNLWDMIDLPVNAEHWWTGVEAPPLNDDSFLWYNPETDDVWKWEA